MTAVDQAQRLRQLVRDQPTPSAPAVETSPAHSSATLPSDRKVQRPATAVQPAIAPIRSRPAARRRARVLTIGSGKGGVGKTNLAVNLAIALAQMNRRVALVDLDMGLANADVICGLKPTINLAHLLRGPDRRLRDLALDAPGGFKLIPGASGVFELADLAAPHIRRLIEHFRILEAQCDDLIFDVSAGISADVLEFSALADTVLVVTTPEPTAIADAYGFIKSVHRKSPGTPMQLIVNQVADHHQAGQVHARIASVARRFLDCTVGYAGSVPHDVEVRRAVLLRIPFCLTGPDTPAASAVQHLARCLVGQDPAVEPPAARAKPSMVQRLARMFGRRSASGAPRA